MKNIRIYHEFPINNQRDTTLTEQASRHIATVLRMSEGDEILLFDGTGRDYRAIITTVTKKHVQVRIEDIIQVENESPISTHLYQAISKGERMDIAIQKSVELGVNEITPVLSERVVVRIDEKRMHKKLEHWHKIIISACEQSGRAVIPKLHPVLTYAKLLKKLENTQSYILSPYTDNKLSSIVESTTTCNIIIGPEGGFTENEIESARRHSITEISLGKRILRTETAPIVALTAIQVLCGEF